MRRVCRRVVLCLGAGALLAGCLSPTLPLPPPSPPDVTQVGQGKYELTGSLPVSGTVYVRNERTELIFGQTVDHIYRFIVDANPGDPMGLWYEAGQGSDFYGDRSQTISFQIDDPRFTRPDGGARSDGGTGSDGAP